MYVVYMYVCVWLKCALPSQVVVFLIAPMLLPVIVQFSNLSFALIFAFLFLEGMPAHTDTHAHLNGKEASISWYACM